ncbi:MAG: MOSC domain-containing protein [Actinomycetota bacterium]|nr:MOSC domain-containing protein [Actinomycetota bacterium]
MMEAWVVSVNIAEEAGGPKHPVEWVKAVENFGLEGDGHAGSAERQVSLLADESVDCMREKGLTLSPGAFGENLTTRGIELVKLEPGAKLKVGGEAVLEVTRIGKECPEPCAIYRAVGDCVMPREGIFARVLSGGMVRKGDRIVVQ